MAEPRSSQLVPVAPASETAALAKPIIEVRELVESFRSCRVIIDGWAEVVRAAGTTMALFERRHPGVLPALAGVVAELDVLLRVGWGDAEHLDRLSAALVELLPSVVPAWVPRPDDERTWAFPLT